jgi:hypothetical protein
MIKVIMGKLTIIQVMIIITTIFQMLKYHTIHTIDTTTVAEGAARNAPIPAVPDPHPQRN